MKPAQGVYLLLVYLVTALVHVHCVFGQFTEQKQPDGSLDLAGADGRLLVVVGKAGSFGSDVELMS